MSGVGVMVDGGLGGASTSTTLSLVGFELAFLESTVRNSSIKSHADGSVDISCIKINVKDNLEYNI